MSYPYSSQSHTTANATTTDFSYSDVPLLADVPHKDQLKVYENGQLRTFNVTGADNYTLNTTSELVIFNSPRASGVTIKIARSTDIENKEVTFTNSSVLTAQDLNKNSDQLLFLCQELYDKAQDISLTAVGAIPPNSIGSSQLISNAGDEAVTTSVIRDDAVTTAKIDDGAVTTAKIDDGAVTTAKIQDGAVTAAKIPDATIVPGKLSTGAPSWNSSGVLSFNSGFGSVSPAYGCRAWGWIIGSSLEGLPFTKTNGVVTVTANAVGMNTGAVIYVEVSNAVVVNGHYTVTTGGANSFVFNDGTTTSGTGTLAVRGWLVQGQGISHVQRTSTGIWKINFSPNMPDGWYSVMLTSGSQNDKGIWTTAHGLKSSTYVDVHYYQPRVGSSTVANTALNYILNDITYFNVAVFR